MSRQMLFHHQVLVDVLEEQTRNQETVVSIDLSSKVNDSHRLRHIRGIGLESFLTLETLDLSGNIITSMEGLQDLKNLKYLNMSRNSIKHIEYIFELKKLETLELSGNFISNLPSEMAELEALQVLDLSGNSITLLKELSYLNGLFNLHTCTFSTNPIASLVAYRDFAVNFIRSLERLDGSTITLEQRQASQMRFYKPTDTDRIRDLGLEHESAQKSSELQIASLHRENQRLRNELQLKSQLLESKSKEWTDATEQLLQLQQELSMFRLDQSFSFGRSLTFVETPGNISPQRDTTPRKSLAPLEDNTACPAYDDSSDLVLPSEHSFVIEYKVKRVDELEDPKIAQQMMNEMRESLLKFRECIFHMENKERSIGVQVIDTKQELACILAQVSCFNDAIAYFDPNTGGGTILSPIRPRCGTEQVPMWLDGKEKQELVLRYDEAEKLKQKLRTLNDAEGEVQEALAQQTEYMLAIDLNDSLDASFTNYGRQLNEHTRDLQDISRTKLKTEEMLMRCQEDIQSLEAIIQQRRASHSSTGAYQYFDENTNSNTVLRQHEHESLSEYQQRTLVSKQDLQMKLEGALKTVVYMQQHQSQLLHELQIATDKRIELESEIIKGEVLYRILEYEVNRKPPSPKPIPIPATHRSALRIAASMLQDSPRGTLPSEEINTMVTAESKMAAAPQCHILRDTCTQVAPRASVRKTEFFGTSDLKSAVGTAMTPHCQTLCDTSTQMTPRGNKWMDLSDPVKPFPSLVDLANTSESTEEKLMLYQPKFRLRKSCLQEVYEVQTSKYHVNLDTKLRLALKRLCLAERSERIDPSTGIEVDVRGGSLGKLDMSVISARDVPKTTRLRSTDSYVILQLIEPSGATLQPEMIYKTGTQHNTLYPRWDEEFQIQAIPSLQCHLHVVLMSYHASCPHERIGETTIPLSELLDQRLHVGYHELYTTGTTHCSRNLPRCAIRLRLQLSYCRTLRLRQLVDRLVPQYVAEYKDFPHYVKSTAEPDSPTSISTTEYHVVDHSTPNHMENLTKGIGMTDRKSKTSRRSPTRAARKEKVQYFDQDSPYHPDFGRTMGKYTPPAAPFRPRVPNHSLKIFKSRQIIPPAVLSPPPAAGRYIGINHQKSDQLKEMFNRMN